MGAPVGGADQQARSVAAIASVSDGTSETTRRGGAPRNAVPGRRGPQTSVTRMPACTLYRRLTDTRLMVSASTWRALRSRPGVDAAHTRQPPGQRLHRVGRLADVADDHDVAVEGGPGEVLEQDGGQVVERADDGAVGQQRRGLLGHAALLDVEHVGAEFVEEGSVTQQAAALLPDSHVVGAFHHLSAVLLEDLSRPTLDGDVMVVGDVREATDLVQALAGRLPGMRGVYAGRLRNARQVEALTINLVSVNRRYKVHAGIRVTDV